MVDSSSARGSTLRYSLTSSRRPLPKPLSPSPTEEVPPTLPPTLRSFLALLSSLSNHSSGMAVVHHTGTTSLRVGFRGLLQTVCFSHSTRSAHDCTCKFESHTNTPASPTRPVQYWKRFMLFCMSYFTYFSVTKALSFSMNGFSLGTVYTYIRQIIDTSFMNPNRTILKEVSFIASIYEP